MKITISSPHVHLPLSRLSWNVNTLIGDWEMHVKTIRGWPRLSIETKRSCWDDIFLPLDDYSTCQDRLSSLVSSRSRVPTVLRPPCLQLTYFLSWGERFNCSLCKFIWRGFSTFLFLSSTWWRLFSIVPNPFIFC